MHNSLYRSFDHFYVVFFFQFSVIIYYHVCIHYHLINFFSFVWCPNILSISKSFKEVEIFTFAQFSTCLHRLHYILERSFLWDLFPCDKFDIVLYLKFSYCIIFH